MLTHGDEMNRTETPAHKRRIFPIRARSKSNGRFTFNIIKLRFFEPKRDASFPFPLLALYELYKMRRLTHCWVFTDDVAHVYLCSVCIVCNNDTADKRIDRSLVRRPFCIKAHTHSTSEMIWIWMNCIRVAVVVSHQIRLERCLDVGDGQTKYSIFLRGDTFALMNDTLEQLLCCQNWLMLTMGQKDRDRGRVERIL